RSQPHARDHPFYVQPALSARHHMEAGRVAAGDAKPPRHTHLGAAIERALHMDRPQHICQDIFRLEVCELLHRMPFCRHDCSPGVNRDARSIVLRKRSSASWSERLAKKDGRPDIVRRHASSYNCANSWVTSKEAGPWQALRKSSSSTRPRWVAE